MEKKIIAQILIIIAYCFIFIGPWQKNRKKYLALSMMASIFAGFHYLLIGAISGSIINFIGVLRAYIFSLKQKNKFFSSWYIPAFFVIALYIITIFTWQDWYSILPALGTTFLTIALWMDDINKIRIISILSSVIWIIYNIFVKSYFASVIEFIILLSTIFAICKFYINKRNTRPQFDSPSKIIDK